LPKNIHKIGKQHTVTIERDNRNIPAIIWEDLQKTKVVSKTAEMVDLSVKLWCILTAPYVFKAVQDVVLSIFVLKISLY
jgi:hypothetical protein